MQVRGREDVMIHLYLPVCLHPSAFDGLLKMTFLAGENYIVLNSDLQTVNHGNVLLILTLNITIKTFVKGS